MPKKALILLAALAGLTIAVYAHDPGFAEGIFDQLQIDEHDLNRAWQALSSVQRDALRNDERIWIKYKDSLPIKLQLGAVEERAAYLWKLSRHYRQAVGDAGFPRPRPATSQPTNSRSDFFMLILVYAPVRLCLANSGTARHLR